jgi:hypothetical protein
MDEAMGAVTSRMSTMRMDALWAVGNVGNEAQRIILKE